MRKNALVLAALVGAGTVLVHPTPAMAAAYTPEAACQKESGRGGWTHVRDNQRAVKSRGTTYGRVYLMWNRRTQQNCVAMIKTLYAGTPTYTQAVLKVQGGRTYRDPSSLTAKKYRYFAAAIGYGKNRCVAFEGYTTDTRTDYIVAAGKRTSFANCG